jgi:hypothetical protein
MFSIAGNYFLCGGGVMKKASKFIAAVSLFAGVLFTFSCYDGTGAGSDSSVSGLPARSVTYDVNYGQNNLAGTLTVSNDDTNIYATWTITAEGVTLNEVHFWAGTDLNLVPVTKDGTPIPGQFPYKAENLNAKSYTLTIPISALGIFNVENVCGVEVFALAHAALSNGETAWSLGTPFAEWTGTSRWGWYSSYVIECEDSEDPEMTAETAFAKGGWVFASSTKANPEGLPSLELNNSRWGWAINITEEGAYTYDLYAGAGLNNVSSGTKVGTVTVSLSSGTVEVSYSLLPGFYMSEAHIYAGDAKPDTIAPGRYGYTGYYSPMAVSASAEFQADDADGDGIWVIAHAVVFGQY